MAVLIDAFNRFAEIQVAVDQVLSDAEASGAAYLNVWAETAKRDIGDAPPRLKVLDRASRLEPGSAKKITDEILAELRSQAAGSDPDPDLAEDLTAWGDVSNDIGKHFGRNITLNEFLQQLQLRSKEPSLQPNTVTLMTVHGAKGREFDFVHLIGLAEDILLSVQSPQRGDGSPEMEEERRLLCRNHSGEGIAHS